MLVKSLVLVFALATLVQGDGRLLYRFYHGPSITDTQDYDFMNFHTVLNHPLFNNGRGTVIFHMAEERTVVTPQVHDIITSYVQRNTHNLIVVHYADPSTNVPGNAAALGNGIATNLINMFDNGLSSGNMNLLGHGIGAQIMARASRQVQSQTNRRHIVGRMTGADPWFFSNPINQLTIGRMSSADAQFVESIHSEGSHTNDGTNLFTRGCHNSRGHVSFFVNGGVAQPMCNQALPQTRNECSHNMALTFWAESVRSPTPNFPALQCDTWVEFTAGQCNTRGQANMGRSTEFNLRGPYMLRTHLTAPFSRNTALP